MLKVYRENKASVMDLYGWFAFGSLTLLICFCVALVRPVFADAWRARQRKRVLVMSRRNIRR